MSHHDELTSYLLEIGGKTESFEALIESEFIRGASVGVTVPTVPYIQTVK